MMLRKIVFVLDFRSKILKFEICVVIIFTHVCLGSTMIATKVILHTTSSTIIVSTTTTTTTTILYLINKKDIKQKVAFNGTVLYYAYYMLSTPITIMRRSSKICFCLSNPC